MHNTNCYMLKLFSAVTKTHESEKSLMGKVFVKGSQGQLFK